MEESSSDLFFVDTAGVADNESNELKIDDVKQTIKKKVDFSRLSYGGVDDILSKAILTPDYDKKAVCEIVAKSNNKKKLERKIQREKTAGKGWNNMMKGDLTEENQRDLEFLQMRRSLDPKSHYRRKDRNVLPKYFEIGRIVDDPVDYYSSRMTKKERKNNMIEELMQDVELVAKTKKRYSQILQKKGQIRRGAFRQKDFLSKRSKYKNKIRSH